LEIARGKAPFFAKKVQKMALLVDFLQKNAAFSHEKHPAAHKDLAF